MSISKYKNMYIYIYIYESYECNIYVHMHTYLHTYLTYIHSCIQTYLHTYIHTCACVYIYIICIYICEWELDYSMTYVPTYIAIILPQPRGRYCRPFGSSITAGPPRKQSPMPKLRIFFCRCGWEQITPVSTKSTYISERISDSQVISRRSPTEPTSG